MINDPNKVTKIALYKLRTDFDISAIEQKYKLVNSGKIEDWSYSIYTKVTPPQFPSWLPLIKSLVDMNKIGKNMYVSLVVIFNKNINNFALTSGYGYVDIHNFSVPDYGIDIALRAADPYGLKTLIQKVPIGNIFSFNRVLRGKYIPESDSINKKSVLRQISGKCQDTNVGKSISGTSSLVISGKKNFREVIDLLDSLIEIEKKEPVVPISGLRQAPKEIYNDLDKILTKKVRNNEFDDLFICFDDEKLQLACETVQVRGEKISFDDTELIFEAAIREDNTGPEKVYIQALDENDQELQKKKLLDILEGEAKYRNNTYFRINKKWYEANKETIKETEKEFSDIKSVKISYLQGWVVRAGKPEDEDSFLNRVFKGNPNLIKAHKNKLISGNIELCDIYDKDGKNLIHVKKGRGAFLRGLFAQSYVSGKLFAGEEAFKREAKEKLGIEGGSDNKIILAIFNPTPANDPFTLFAKVDLVERVTALKENGYVVEYCLITPKNE